MNAEKVEETSRRDRSKSPARGQLINEPKPMLETEWNSWVNKRNEWMDRANFPVVILQKLNEMIRRQQLAECQLPVNGNGLHDTM